MALVKCKECGEKVSTKAKACPNCGAKPPKKTSFVTWGVLLIIGLAVYGGMQENASKTPEQRAAEAQERQQREAEEARKEAAEEARRDERIREYSWMEAGKDAVRAKLKDPDSAEFRNVVFVRGEDDVPVTCGEVNAHNSFGGKSGFQHFLSAGSPERTWLEEEVQDFASLWNRFCAGG